MGRRGEGRRGRLLLFVYFFGGGRYDYDHFPDQNMGTMIRLRVGILQEFPRNSNDDWDSVIFLRPNNKNEPISS